MKTFKKVCFVCLVAFLFFTEPVWSASDVAKAFADALKSRSTGTIEEVTQNFQPYLGIEGSAKLSDNVTLNGLAKFYSNNQGDADTRLTDFDLALLFGRDYYNKPPET